MPTTAIIVARGGSVRLPRKALLPFGDSTLIGHKVRTLLACERVGRVVVASDDDEILTEGAWHGAEVVRNLDYRDDAREMVADTVARVPGLADDDVVVWAHPTNPLVTAGTYDDALRWYGVALAQGFDSLASVYRVQRHGWTADGRPFNFDPWGTRHPLARDIPRMLFQDGAAFVQTAGRFKATRYFYGARPYLFEMPDGESIDIDTAKDYSSALLLAGCNGR